MIQRRELVDNQHELSIRRQCDLLSINRGGVYYKPKGEKSENLEIMRLMDEHYLDHPTEGVLSMQDYLRLQGYIINHKRVRRLLRLMGLMAIYPKKNLSMLGLKKYIHPYLLQGLKIERPNQVWEIDITYIPMKNGFLYLTAIIDLYSRYVIGWGLSNTLEAEATLSVLRQAILEHGKPEIINSDQGSQFTSEDFIGVLESHGISISMDGKGRWMDNVFIERLWWSVKYQDVYLKAYSSIAEVRKGLGDYFEFYNSQRRHQSLDRKTPDNVYLSILPKMQVVA